MTMVFSDFCIALNCYKIEMLFIKTLRQLQRCHAVHLQSVEARRVLQHGRIAALLHIGQDVGHALLDGRVRVRRPMQALRKIVFEVGVKRGQAGGSGLVFHGAEGFSLGEWPMRRHR